MASSLLPFFHPRGVVVVGASASPEKLGYGVARNLTASGYEGAIHFVSRKSGDLLGRPIYPSLAQVPDPVDLAVLVVPPQVMPGVIEDCGRRGIRAAILVASGFREIGPEGAVLEQHCVDTAKTYGLRLLGPNCIGTLDTHLPLDTTFLHPPMPNPGHIGFISHSGAFCAAIIDWARHQGFSFSRLVSLGNQADVNETDMLPVFAADGNTRVITMYMESVSDGRRFVRTAEEVTRQKPVLALKAGRFESGQKAAASHTGALAASDTAFAAAFEKAGILRADTAEQMFDWAQALAACPLPRGNKIAILTGAGGPGVIAADSLEMNGLMLAHLSPAARATLAAQLPPAASLSNPVDMLASATPATYIRCLTVLLAEPNVDGVIILLPPPPMYGAETVAEALIPVIQQSDKPVLVALMGSDLTAKARDRFSAENIPTYPFPERAVSALAALARRAELIWHDDSAGEQRDFRADAAAIPEMSPYELIATYGIQIAPIQLACSADEAAAIAAGLGFPVAMKIASPDILHKSDVGGVLLNLDNPAAVRAGYAQMTEHIQSIKPETQIQGVHIQRQIAAGQDVIAGMVRDPQFGPLMMFGSGGVEVEGLKDVAFALAPLNPTEGREMLQRTWAGRKLKGFRQIPPADAETVIDVLIRLSWLAVDHDCIAEIEINPLRVLNKGAVAVDVRIKYDSAGQ